MKNIITITIMFLILLGFISCQTQEQKEIISEDKFIDIVYDLHLMDGVLVAEKLNTKISPNDTVSYYNYVLKKNNVSRAEFDKTVEYYTEHTDEYAIIYGKVLKKINELQEDKKNKEKTEADSTKVAGNLWNLKAEWHLPEDGVKNSIPYEFELNIAGKYTVSADIKMYEDDKTDDPRLTIIANYSDGTRDTQSDRSMEKDGKFHTYILSIITDKNKKLESISGWILDHGKTTLSKHSEVKNIKITYEEMGK